MYKKKNCDCEENFDCGCQVKDLGTKCVIYDGEYLSNLNIQKNTDLTTLFKAIDYKFQSGGTPSFVNVINLGTGVGVYKGTDGLNRLGFKSLKSNDSLLVISSEENEVGFSINRQELNDLITEELSPTTYIFGSQSAVQSYNSVLNTLSFKNIVAGTNIQINHGQNDITISATGSMNLTSDTLTIVPITGGYKVDTPKDFIRRLYVNNTYSGSNADGTISKPFATIAQAITAYIGTGTYLNPQLANQGVIIHVQRTGVSHNMPDSLLVKNLHLYLEQSVVLVNNNASPTEYTIDFDSLPSSEAKFQVTITGEDRESTFINTQRLFCRNTGYGVGTSDGSYAGRNLTISGLRLSKTGTTVNSNYFITTQVNYFVNTHNNFQAPFNFTNVDFRGNSSSGLFYLGNSSNIVFQNCKIFFSTPSDSTTSGTYPFFWGGDYVRFESCHFICPNNFTNGIFYMKNGGIQGTMEIFNSNFEGNVSNLFVFAPDTLKQKLVIRRANPFFQNFTKVIHSTNGDVTTVSMTENSFNASKGDVDLTMGNTTSVSNYFNGRLTEHLIRSATVLNRTNYPEGTIYIHTAGSTNQADWKRSLIY